MIRALGYTRVSTEEQAREGLSLEMQADRIRAYCAAERWELVDVFSDPGISGAQRQRPGLDRLLASLPGVGALVVWKLDRLARNARHLLEIVEQLQGRGIRFVSVTESFDTGTAAGKLQLTILAACAEFERELMRDRCREASAQRARQGKWAGRAPWGYQLVDGDLRPHPANAAHLRHAYELLLGGMSLRSIARWLTGTTGGGPAGGPYWEPYRLKAVLESPVNAGQVRWRDEVMPGLQPAIIPREIWEAAQARLRSISFTGRRSPRRLLLSGVLRCCYCGGPMSGSRHPQTLASGRTAVYADYNCRRRTLVGDCPGCQISERKAVALLATALRSLTPDQIQELPREHQTSTDEPRLGQQLAMLERHRARLVGLLTREIITEVDFARESKALEQQRLELATEIERANRPAELPAPAFFSDLAALLASDRVPLEERRRVVCQVFAAITISGGEVRLRVRVPGLPAEGLASAGGMGTGEV